MESEEFMLLPVNQLVDIISSDELNVRSEEQVFSAVMGWVKYNIQERRVNLPTVSISLKLSTVAKVSIRIRLESCICTDVRKPGNTCVSPTAMI